MPASGSITESVQVNGGAQLNGVACPDTEQCTGVDENGYETTFTPATGAVISSTKLFLTGNYAEAVDCPSVSQCTAVSRLGDIATFNPQAASSCSHQPGSTRDFSTASPVPPPLNAPPSQSLARRLRSTR